LYVVYVYVVYTRYSFGGMEFFEARDKTRKKLL
jgi:hypothetical protein